MEFLKVFCINRTSSRFPAVPGILTRRQDVYLAPKNSRNKKVPLQLFSPTRNSGPTVFEKSNLVGSSKERTILRCREGWAIERSTSSSAFLMVPRGFLEGSRKGSPRPVQHSPAPPQATKFRLPPPRCRERTLPAPPKIDSGIKIFNVVSKNHSE